MKYRKPEVLDLGGRMKRAHGQVKPNSCVSGSAAREWETCASGGAPASITSCVPGTAASADGDCLSGSSVHFYCETGSSGADDFYGCNNGPSYS